MLYFGSGESFSRMIRQYAKERGYRLTQKNLVDLKTKKEIYLPTEEAIFAYLGLPYQKPEER
jgi:DNA polymerase/3'-5' exonuclease PolX